MAYGFPEKDSIDRFRELNNYERMRFHTRNMSYKEKVSYLQEKYPEDLVHGFYDAISPQINDLLQYGEIEGLLKSNGFSEVRRTIRNANIHLVARKNVD